MTWTLIVGSILLLAPSTQGPSRGDGVLLLKDGTRVAGTVDRTAAGYKVTTPARTRRFDASDVQRFVSRAELVAQYDRMANRKGAGTPFQLAQRTTWAFENGLRDRAWLGLGHLLDIGSSPASMDELERAAARDLLEHTKRSTNRRELARRILLSADTRKKDSVTRAKHHAASKALVTLLAGEARDAAQQQDGEKPGTRKNDKKSVAGIVRKYAAGAVSQKRRSIARRALLAFDEDAKHYVWRQAMLWPRGPNRSHVVAEIREADQADDAATYLTRWLNRGSATLKLRSAEALGELGSKSALPALHAMRSAIRKKVAARRQAGAGAVRANVSFIETQSYIADFNVEIAQAAAIADPVVRQVQSGVVLDATVGGISWDRYIIVLDNAVRNAIDSLSKE